LSTVWRDAVGTSAPICVDRAIAAGVSPAPCGVGHDLTLTPGHPQLLADGGQAREPIKSARQKWEGGIGAVAGGWRWAHRVGRGATRQRRNFFGAGALCLIAGIAFARRCAGGCGVIRPARLNLADWACGTAPDGREFGHPEPLACGSFPIASIGCSA
jgi:hypothetical protein